MIYNDFSPFYGIIYINQIPKSTRTEKKSCVSLADIYNDISFSIQEQKPELLALLDEYIDFDSYDNYSMLKNDFHFNRVCIPLNLRNSKKANTSFDEFGTPICPIDKTPFTFLGKSGGKNRSARFKWVCHKSKPCGTSRICTCETPCTESSYGKCTYTYPDKDFRLYPGIPRNTEHWERLYNVRVVIERTINLFKDTFGVASLKTQNETTIKTDLYLAGITQLIGVILAKELQKPKLYKSVRKLISAL